MFLETITEIEGLERIKKQWNALLLQATENSIFLTYQWFFSWWKNFSKDKSLEIIIGKDKNGHLLAIAPFIILNITPLVLVSSYLIIVCRRLLRRPEKG